MTDDRFPWQTALHARRGWARSADVDGHRLYVRRTAPGARSFIGSIDGVPVKGGWTTIDHAMAAVAVEFRKRFPVVKP